MSDYRTPGVYVEEKSVLPGSVAGVSTAVPAFIGYTKKAGVNYELHNTPTKITNLKEYEELFGVGTVNEMETTTDGIDVTIDASNTITVTIPQLTKIMYYSMQMFFNNGGESCYIVSVGDDQANEQLNFQDAINSLQLVDEPTLIVLVDAINLSVTDYYTLSQLVLAQCNDMKDRFAILNVPETSGATSTVDADATDFRTRLSSDALKYGAAYYPNINTTLGYQYNDSEIDVTFPNYSIEICGLMVTYTGTETSPQVSIEVDTGASAITFEEDPDGVLAITVPTATTTAAEVAATSGVPADFQLAAIGDGTTVLTTTAAQDLIKTCTLENAFIKVKKTDLYNKIKKKLDSYMVTLPPAAAVAGKYASVDRDRGVWKAPANISLASVIGPTKKLTDEENAILNVDENSGKSINAIRSFTGKGVLIWGARTLAGNDNEWRYVSVRRFFNYVEESIQKATAYAVFEPNVAMTWLKLRSMIESFLDGLWKQGALAGGKAEDAYFVQCGLGTTMTSTDILEGRLVIKVGMAVVRPAEFIILEFTHKLQE